MYGVGNYGCNYGYGYNNYPVQNSANQMQQRLNQMEQQFPQYSGNQMQNQIIKGRAVTSIDEAKAAMIDVDGSIFVFPDIANKRIYTKQVNLDGTASLNTYELVQTPISAEQQLQNVDKNNVVSRDEFNNIMANMQDEISRLKIELSKLNQEVANNVQSYAIDDGANATAIIEQPIVQEGSRNGKWKK